MLFKDGNFELAVRVSVWFRYWPGSGDGSGKKRSGWVELNGCWVDVRELHTGFVQEISIALLLASNPSDVINRVDESHTGSLRRPSCIKGGLAALCVCCCGNNQLQGMVFSF